MLGFYNLNIANTTEVYRKTGRQTQISTIPAECKQGRTEKRVFKTLV